MKFELGNEISRMYEQRQRRRAAACGLGSSTCCASCAKGKPCEAKTDVVEVHATILEAGTKDGVGKLLEMARSGVGAGQKVGEGDFFLDTIRDGVGGGAQAGLGPKVDGRIPEETGFGPKVDGRMGADGLGTCAQPPPGGRWVPADLPVSILQLLPGQPEITPGGTMPPGSAWQQVVHDGVWYGMYRPPPGSPAQVQTYMYSIAQGVSGAPDGIGAAGCPEGFAWDPYTQQCIRTSYGTIIDTYDHSDIAGTGALPCCDYLAGLPAGLGVTAAQIDQDLTQANSLASADVLDYTDAVTACDTAITDTISAEQALTSSPSMAIIGSQSGIVTQLLANRKAASVPCTSSDYQTAYNAATTAYQAYLKDAALPANVIPSAPPAPAPAPPPPIVVVPSSPPAPGNPPPPPPPPSTSSGSGTNAIILGATAVGATILGYALYKRYYGKTSASRAKTRVPSGRTVRA
jgi:hypothetical protein